MKISGTVEIVSFTDVVCDVCQLSTRVTGGEIQFTTLKRTGGMARIMRVSAMSCTSVKAAFFKQWLISNRNGVPKHSSAMTAVQIGPLLAMFSV
ncbi:hypothetical protein [Pseudomonas arsenicoxydans]|uniref:hypothetical protein n=1 Tax=Pseudomonas arsenicoxydans TaxID=702115 RepID=UPI0031F36A69